MDIRDRTIGDALSTWTVALNTDEEITVEADFVTAEDGFVWFVKDDAVVAIAPSARVDYVKRDPEPTDDAVTGVNEVINCTILSTADLTDNPTDFYADVMRSFIGYKNSAPSITYGRW